MMNPNHAIAKAAKRNGKFASGAGTEVLLAPRKARNITEPAPIRILFPICILCVHLPILHPFTAIR
jgi:hypothetical protein